MRILIVKLSSLGDLFHALPAVHNIKTGLGAEIHWVTQSEYADLVRCFTDVDRVIPFPRHNLGAELRIALRRLRMWDYDYVLDLQGLLKSAAVSFLARAPRKIGPSFHRECAFLFYSAAAGRRDRSRHAVDQCMDTVRHLGLSCLGLEFPVAFPSAGRSEPRPRVGLLPVSRWRTKNWPEESFAAVGRAIRERRDATIYLLGGPADRAVCERIEKAIVGTGDEAAPGAANQAGRVVNLAGTMTLPAMGGLIGELDLLISNDSGPIHMAAAVRTPTLVVFGPTDPRRTGAYGSIHRVVRANRECQPCFSRSCRFGDVPCLKEVSPDRVVEEAMQVLDAARRRAGGTAE
jgi:lipopolysaccharide heptosyltransferase I